MSDPSEAESDSNNLHLPSTELQGIKVPPEMPMLEDEEMPTYNSVSSPSRPEDIEIRNELQRDVAPLAESRNSSPYLNDEQGEDSIYVVSSGEESDQPPFDEEDDTDEEYDTDEIDEMEFEDEMEEEEEDDDGETHVLEDGDESDGDIEPELFERASDDLVLRHSSDMERGYKTKSQSLQDLSVCEAKHPARLSKKGRSFDALGHNDSVYLQNALLFPFSRRKSSTPRINKYCHVESKVRRYIQEIKEQNRRSKERRLRNKEYLVEKSCGNVGDEVSEGNDENISKAAVTNKIIKDYAEKAMKDLEIREFYNKDEIVQILPCKMENGQGILETKLTLQDKECTDVAKDVDIDNEPVENRKTVVNHDAQTEKHNGTVENDVRNHILESCIENGKRFRETNGACLFNSQEEAQNICNLRTVSYEEYMRGGLDSNQKTANMDVCLVVPEVSEEVPYNNEEVISITEVDNNKLPCSLKIESVQSIRVTAEKTKDDCDNSSLVVEMADAENELVHDETSEVALLRTQLDQKSTQFHAIREVYQKTLVENFELKRELDDLKKMLAKCQKESEPRQTKVVAVQTEALSDQVSIKKVPSTIKQPDKLSVSSISSAVSSDNHWLDSSNSLGVSIKPPPNITILNSDDSLIGIEGTPKKIIHPLSRAFITSSRILQTLSNITHGRAGLNNSRVDNIRNNEGNNLVQDMTKEINSPLLSRLNVSTPNHLLNPKKRKATEMLGNSNFLQPFKIPHTLADSQRKISSISSTNEKFEHSGDHSSTSPRANPTSVSNNINCLADSGGTQNIKKMERGDDKIDGVKCFTYQDDECSKDRSFLIQAEESDKANNANERGHVRECGPYLLGNVEVRMSEVNGTINIWGKEISQNSIHQEEDEIEIFPNSNESSSYYSWQKTPRTQLTTNDQVICSTNNKLKVPPPLRYSDSSIPKSSNSVLPDISKITIGMEESNEEQRASSSCSTNNVITGCENCDLQKNHRSWVNHKRVTSTQERQHSCCARLKEFHEADCICSWNQEKYNDRPTCNRVTLEDQRCSSTNASNLENNTSKHSCNNSANQFADAASESTFRHACKTCHRYIEPNVQGNDCHRRPKQCHCSRENVSHDNFETTPTNLRYPNHDNSHLCCRSPSNNDETNPLLPQQRSHETPEQQIKRRRLSGKKVRGILMDFLKGCGDCRRPNSTNTNRAAHPQTTESTCLRNYTSSTPSPTAQVRQSQQRNTTFNKSTDTKCCQVCNRRVEMATEIETQLEFFRVEMERLRTRSDAVLSMLNMLHSTDLN